MLLSLFYDYFVDLKETVNAVIGLLIDELQEKQQTMLFRILRSGWTKAAAAIILVIGTGLFTAETIRNRNNVVEQHEIINGGKNSEEVFAIDTFDKQDSVYYHNKYGDDFKF